MTQERELDLLESRGETEPVITTLRLGVALERHRQRLRVGSGESYLLKAIGRRPIASKLLSDLRREHVLAYRDQRLKEVGPTTVARELWLVQRTVELAKHEWGCSGLKNPAADVTKPRLPHGRERRLTGDEEARLLSHAALTKTPMLREVILFALATAMRQGEILSLTWTNCDLEGRTALLPKTKNGKARTVPLSAGAIKVLRSLEGPSEGRVFSVSVEAIKQAWPRLVAKADILDLRFHDLRHEAVSRLFERGLEMPEVMMVSGHTDPRMLLRYTHLHARRIIEKLDASE